jgi:hypothetical protein
MRGFKKDDRPNDRPYTVAIPSHVTLISLTLASKYRWHVRL